MENSDNYCEKIFTLLVATERKIRFNELFATLNSLGVKMSKPTLIEHLHHLQKKGFILRKKEDKQNVTYQVKWEKFEQLHEHIEFKKAIANNLRNEEIFKSHSLEEQLNFVVNVLTMVQTIHIQLNVYEISYPKAKANVSLGYILIHNLYDVYRRWFLDTCRESPENAKRAMNLLENATKSYQNTLFEQSEK